MSISYKIYRSLWLASAASAVVYMTAPAAAQAQDVDGGVYVTGRIGIALPSDFDVEGVQAPEGPSPGAPGAPASVSTQLDNEITFSGAIGYKLPVIILGVVQPSFELEYSYTDLDVDGGSFNDGDQTFSGDLEAQTFTLNYQGDFIFSEDQKLIPFLGGGIGIADIDSDIQYFPASASAPIFGVIEDDSAFVYQFDAGVRFELSDAISLDARARYQRVDGVDLERRFIGGGNNAFNAEVTGDFETVNFTAGIRYTF